jgi:hypothetical protein
MLGRHIYRVHLSDGRWTITKEGEPAPRANHHDRASAVEEACRLANLDQPSRVTIDDGDGKIVEERQFGADLSQELGR